MTKPRDLTLRSADDAPLAAKRPSSPPPAPPRFTTLQALVAHLGASSMEEVDLVLDHPPPAELAERGRSFVTTRGTDDAVRIYGAAVTFLDAAPPAVRAKVAISPGLLRVSAWVALEADRAYAAQTAGATARKQEREVTTARASDALGDARAHRDQLADVVANVAGKDAEFAARIKTARAAKAPDGRDNHPASSLTQLVAVARDLLASEDAGVRSRCGFYELTGARVDEAAAVAAGADAAAREAAAPKVAANTHRTDVEVLDGMNHRLMERVIEIFAKAHARDLTVPKLRFVSLQPRATKKKVGEEKPEEK